jgi:UDP-N-acetylmuramoyl-L-alanyl-D-glutamate--2,6-diaminopimelate ligase
VAIRGTGADGHDYITQVAPHCLVLVVEDRSTVPPGFQGAVLVTSATRLALAELAAVWSSHPSRELFVIGVTGTNGKTTTTMMIEHLLSRAGWPTGVIGTIDHHLGDRIWPTELTTPGPVELQERLRDFCSAGARAVAFETSSHALDQARVDGVDFDVGIFTNLTRDHLDYHGDMERYFQAKARLFSDILPSSEKRDRRAVLNGNDPMAKRLREVSRVPVWLTGQHDDADFQWTCLQSDLRGSRGRVRTPFGERSYSLPMMGRHNIENAMGALAATLAAGVSLDTALHALESMRVVRGRLQVVSDIKERTVIVDYAHTDDALKSVLSSLRQVMTSERLWTVFGCGGDRDRGKRPLMLQAALDGSDRVVITSDNPRHEDPESILDDIMKGLRSSDETRRVVREVNRRQAIRQALELSNVGDVVLIAGKGHETTQQIGAVKHPFDDVAVALEEWRSLRGP